MSEKNRELFLTSGARQAFTKLRQIFVAIAILNHFDPEHHIRIETNFFGYTIGGILNQLTWDDFTKTWYKTQNSKLLAIVKVFKTWKHYLEGCKHEVLVLTDHDNF